MDTCPNCGYCKHCGRSAHTPWYPPYYVQPWPRPYYDITWTAPTITCGGTATTGNTVRLTNTEQVSWTSNQ